MARIRSIKPDFWSDEKLVELDYSHRLFFIGLWNFADDQGFIDYRPKRIKMQVFPGDNYDVDEGLRVLHRSSLVSLYGGPEGLILRITNWDKHQRVSNPARERFTASDLHKYTDWDDGVQSPLEPSRVLGKGREGKGSTSSSEIADAIPDEQSRPEVERLCTQLADRIEANGSKRPPIGKGWKDAARLMLDRDKRTEEQITWLIDWCQNDEFWKTNILSMSKLREKFDQMRLKAASDNNVQPIRGSRDPDAWMQRRPGDSEWG